MKKKLLSALLVFSMLLTLLPTWAMAGYFGDQVQAASGETLQEYIKTVYAALTADKIATGTVEVVYGTAKLSNPYTQDELAAVQALVNKNNTTLEEMAAAASYASTAYLRDHPEVFWTRCRRF